MPDGTVRPAGGAAPRPARGGRGAPPGPTPLPAGRTVLGVVLAFASVLVLMGGAAAGVGAIFHAGGTDSIDHSVWRWVVDHRTSGLDTVARALTQIADTNAVLPLTVLSAAVLVWFRRSRDAAFVAASVAGAYLTTSILKAVIARPRPPVAQRLVTEHEWSFPSGHATQSVALYGALLVLVVAGSGRGTRTVGWCAGALIALVVGWTRIYLGVHWFSDVLGGWMIGASWLATLAWLLGYTRIERRTGEGTPAGSEAVPTGDPEG